MFAKDMAFLNRVKKKLLLALAAEYEIHMDASALRKDIVKAISEAVDFDEQTAKDYLADAAAEEERLKLSNNGEDSRGSLSGNGAEGEADTWRFNLKDCVPRFEPEKIDIALFFVIFERQAKMINLPEGKWVFHLIPFLPADIVSVIIKEPPDLSENYAHEKRVLLNRFRLSAAALRGKFESHQRKFGSLRSDLVYELRGYLENWLEVLEIQDFETLKERLILESLKKRVDPEVRDRFLDSWEDFKNPSDLANKLDSYESVRRTTVKGRNVNNWEKRSFGREKTPVGALEG